MSDFLFPIIEIVLGVVLLFAGGEFFIQGAIFLSLILGIPQIVIGLTVVSLGTSSPELLVSLLLLRVDTTLFQQRVQRALGDLLALELD